MWDFFGYPSLKNVFLTSQVRLKCHTRIELASYDWKSHMLPLHQWHAKITPEAKDSKQPICLLPFRNPAFIHKLSFVTWLSSARHIIPNNNKSYSNYYFGYIFWKFNASGCHNHINKIAVISSAKYALEPRRSSRTLNDTSRTRICTP